MRKFICSDCHYVGKPLRITKGSLIIEIILWICFFIPGLIYSIWRQTSKQSICPACRHQSTMIPVSSPKGANMLAEID